MCVSEHRRSTVDTCGPDTKVRYVWIFGVKGQSGTQTGSQTGAASRGSGGADV